MSDKLVTIFVDGAPVEVPAGTSVVDAAHEAGVEIPIFCHHPNLEPVGMCRMCLVEVGTPAVDRATGQPELDDEGNPVIRMFPKLQAGCTMRASEGMVVNTTNQEVTDARRSVLEFLLTSHPLDCPVCDKGGECPLQNLTMRYGPGQSRFTWGEKYHFEKPVPIGPLIALDRERCVLCARCIRFEDEIADDQVLGFENRGRGMEIVSFSDPPFQSYFSGNTSDICPVGALTTKDFRFEARAWEVVGKPSVCSHCPVGCNTMIDTRFGSAERVMPRRNDEVNEIWLCDKGRFAHHFASDPERLTTPLIRRDGELQPASWDEALGLIAEHLSKAKRVHGAESIGGIAGPGLANEDLYLFGRLMRGLLGSNNLDHRPSMLRDDLIARAGAKAEGGSLSNLGKGDVVVVAGLDVEEEAPVAFLNLLKGVSRGAKLVIVSGQPQKLDRHADAALRYRYSAADSLMAALLRGLLDAKAEGDALGETATAMRDALAGADVDSLSGVHPVGPESLATAVDALAGASRVLGLYGREAAEQGLDQPLAALVSACGDAGAAGGLIAVGSHANSQGAADMGVLPDHLPGYGRLDDAEARAKLAEAWSSKIDSTPGKSAQQMLDKDHGLHALFLMGTDPAGDDPRMSEALQSLDFLVVQELFLTPSAQLADVVLPARSAPERAGSYTNMQRRIQRFYASVDAVGKARPDWEILRDLGQRLGAAEPYSSPDDVFEEIARVVPGYGELSYDALGAPPPPDPSSMILPFAPQTDARSVSYHGTAYDNAYGDGKVWSNAASRDAEAGLSWRPREQAGGENGAGGAGMAGALTLVPTRKLYDMGALVAPSKILHPLVAPPMVEISAFDAAPRGLADGMRVKVMGIRGALEAELRIRDGITPGVLQAPESLAWSLPVRALLNGSPTAEVMLERIEEAVPAAPAAASASKPDAEGEVDA